MQGHDCQASAKTNRPRRWHKRFKQRPPTVRDIQLLQDYQVNEVLADEKFTIKQVHVKGSM